MSNGEQSSTIEAMKQALEALEIVWTEEEEISAKAHQVVFKAITSLHQAIAEAEKQEPVAWMTITDAGEEDDIWYSNPEGKLLEGWTYIPLYPQPKREWVGLTDKEYSICLSAAIDRGYRGVADAVEQKLKEKNT